tara:strand:- start:19273 stop:19965 length:693 start_codon:yes stop_codon:yes gene_type:complete
MLAFKNIKMIFDYNSVLENISGEFTPGKFIAVTGKNGSGKTTLIRILAGLQKPTAGQVYFYNKNVFDISVKRLAELRSYIPSNSLCHWDLYIEDIIKLGLLKSKESKAEKHLKVHNILSDLGLVEFKGRKINTLSSGEKAMVYLARALISNPDYIFGDEILSNLHQDNQHKIMRYLKTLAAKGKAVILITHNMDMAKEYCDSIYNLDSGQSLNTLHCRYGQFGNTVIYKK